MTFKTNFGFVNFLPLTLSLVLVYGCNSISPTKTEDAKILCQAKNHAGLAALKNGDYVKAQSLLQDALNNAERLGPGYPQLAATLNNLASVYDAQGNYQEAEAGYLRAVAEMEKSNLSRPAEKAVFYSNLARVEGELNRYEEAAQNYKKALDIMENSTVATDMDLADSLDALGDIYVKLGKYNLAEPIYRRTITYDMRSRKINDPKAVSHLEEYAQVIRTMHRLTDADQLDALVKSRKAKP